MENAIKAALDSIQTKSAPRGTWPALAAMHMIDGGDPRLIQCAEALGSDVPACVRSATALGRGRGEALTPVTGMAGTPMLLVNPGVAVSTASVFARWDGVDRGALPQGDARAIALEGRNDLEGPAISLCPQIAGVLAALDGTAPFLARMSGSGATCFALYDDVAARENRVATGGGRG